MLTTGESVPTIDNVLESWKLAGVRNVRFELPDMHGTSRSKIVPIGHTAGYASMASIYSVGQLSLIAGRTSCPARCTTKRLLTAISCCGLILPLRPLCPGPKLRAE